MNRTSLVPVVALVTGGFAASLGLLGAGPVAAEPTPRVDPCTGSQTGWYTAYSSGDNIDTDVSACIYINGSGQMNIGGWATHTWSQTVSGTNVQWGCYWTNSSALSVTYGWMADEIDTGLVDGEYIPMSTTTATNWEVDTKQWAAGAGWWFPDTTNLDPGVFAAMQPPAQDTGGCNAASNGMPEVTLTANPPGPVGTYSARSLSASMRASRTADFYTITVGGPADEPLSAMCRLGTTLVDVEAGYLPSEVGDTALAPEPFVSGERATLPPSTALRGDNQLTVACAAADAALTRQASTVIGSSGADRWTDKDTNLTVLAGKGDDHIRVQAYSQAVGGQGRDVLVAGGRDSVVSGGSGPDVLKASTQHRVLLIGGPGSDRFMAGSGKAHVNAQDGARDVIECESSRNRVLVDPEDKVIGPCTVVNPSR